SSASASNLSGTSRPSAFAVLRFMIISNLVGSSTGRSAGLSPRGTSRSGGGGCWSCAACALTPLGVLLFGAGGSRDFARQGSDDGCTLHRCDPVAQAFQAR